MHTGTYDEAKKEEDKIIKDLKAGKTKVEQSTGKLLTVTDENEDKPDSQSGKGEPKKRRRKLLNNRKSPAVTDKRTGEESQSEDQVTEPKKKKQKSSTNEKPAANQTKTTAKKARIYIAVHSYTCIYINTDLLTIILYQP